MLHVVRCLAFALDFGSTSSLWSNSGSLLFRCLRLYGSFLGHSRRFVLEHEISKGK